MEESGGGAIAKGLEPSGEEARALGEEARALEEGACCDR